MTSNNATDADRWWLAGLGDTLVWARLRLRDSGSAEVFGATGEILRYDDEDSARAALLDAEFRAYDGLDDEDAALLGFDLNTVSPPKAKNDAALLPLMIQKLMRGHG